MKKLIGRTILLERKTEDGKGLDYNCGEYLVINQSPMTLYCCKLGSDGVYALHNLSSFLMEGTRAWQVVKDTETPKEELLRWIDNIEKRISTELGSPNKQWVDSVYTNAKVNLITLKRELGLEKESTLSVVSDSTITITVGIRDGKLVII